MQPDLLEAFSMSIQEVLANLCQCEVTVNPPKVMNISETTEDITIVLNIAGKISGQILYTMNINSGSELVSSMIGMPVSKIEESDELSISTLSEISNIITGNALTRLSENGFYCEATAAPLIIFGKNKVLKVLNPIAQTFVSSTSIGDFNVGIITV